MKVFELLKTEGNWCKDTRAKDVNDKRVPVISDERAVKFCLEGAIERCYPDEKKRDEIEKRVLAMIKTFNDPDWNEPFRTIAMFNDSKHTTYKEVYGIVLKLEI